MKVIITGGLGFIGTNLLFELANKFDELVVFDDLSTSLHKKLADYNFPFENRMKFYPFDLGNLTKDQLSIFELELDNAELVFHFASPCGVKFFDLNPEMNIMKMYKMNQDLIPLFAAKKVKVVFASSSEMYGNNLNCKESDVLQIESTQVLRWGYAANKLMTEILLNAYGVTSIVLRFFNVTGKGQLSDHGMVLPRWVEAAKNNQDILIYGDGKQVRSFCDVRDAVSMIMKLIEDEKNFGQIYNIGNDENIITLNDLATQVVNNFSSKSQIKYKEFNQVLSTKSKDILQRAPDCGKIKKIYKAKYKLKQILENM